LSNISRAIARLRGHSKGLQRRAIARLRGHSKGLQRRAINARQRGRDPFTAA
jgi:hypothetical protein